MADEKGNSAAASGGDASVPPAGAQTQDELSEKERKRIEKEKRRQAHMANFVKPEKQKLSKKERRELQEKQKAAKQQQKPTPQQQPAAAAAAGGAGSNQPQQQQVGGGGRGRVGVENRSTRVDSQAELSRDFGLFSHLPAYTCDKSSSSLRLDKGNIHPAILSLGLRYSKGEIQGSNARVVAMLTAIKQVIKDYEAPEKATIARDLDRRLKVMINFLIKCRPHSITMGNAIKYLRHAVTTLPPDMSEQDAKEELLQVIDTYIHTNITLAQQEIVKLSMEKISDGDTILTFGRSHIVEKVLLEAHKCGLKFKVVVVSARPKEEGKVLLEVLANAGIDCAYILLTSIAYMMGSVDKVILGAAALLSNGTALARAGTALVAMMAKSFNVPVLICAETHKFTERVQLDSICYNELGDPNELVLAPDWNGEQNGQSHLTDWQSQDLLTLLNLTYDLTAQEHITLVITEFGMLPTSSVPVIVREKEQQQ